MALTTSLSLTFIWQPYVSIKNDPVSPFDSLALPAMQCDAPPASPVAAWSSSASSRSHAGVGQLISLSTSAAVNTLTLPLLLLPTDSTMARKSRSPGRAVDIVVALAVDVAADVATVVVAAAAAPAAVGAVVDALDSG